ncbi:MAG: amidohydrolase family protein [Bryobacteraceae bacterium]
MPQPILLRGAKQLLTLHGPAGARRGAALEDLSAIEDGAVLICDGKIAHVGMTRRIENLKEARDALDIAVHGRVVMPAFCDPGLNLGLEPAGEMKRRKRPAELSAEAQQLMRACRHHGTLTAAWKASADAADFHADLAVLRQLARIAEESREIVQTWRVGFGRGERDFLEVLEAIARRKLADSVEIEAIPGSPLGEDIFRAIDDSGLGRKLSWPGGSPDALSRILGRFHPQSVFCPQPLVGHECRVLAGSAAVAVFSPGEHALEGGEANSARAVADAGGAIALSSGYDSRHTLSFSMQMVVALAVFRLRLSAEEAIAAATINAAYARGCGETAGSLECGKRANVLVLDISDYRDLPRQFGVNHVAIAIRDGAVAFSRNRWKAGAA